MLARALGRHGRLARGFCSPALSERISALRPHRRSALRQQRDAIKELGEQVEAGGAALEQLSAWELSSLCRVLTAGSWRVSEALLRQAAKKCQADDADSLALLSLAASEAEADAVAAEVMLMSRAISAGTPQLEHVESMVALALAAAASGRADATLLGDLLRRLSLRELELDVALLGDLRLAVGLAGPSVVDQLEATAASFYHNVCAVADLDCPRSPLPNVQEYASQLTAAENEVSEALNEAELPHSRGLVEAGSFFPLSSKVRQCIVCVEDTDAAATYLNAPAERTNFQRWKYRLAANAGWSVFAVDASEWTATSKENRVELLKQILQASPVAEPETKETKS